MNKRITFWLGLQAIFWVLSQTQALGFPPSTPENFATKCWQQLFRNGYILNILSNEASFHTFSSSQETVYLIEELACDMVLSSIEQHASCHNADDGAISLTITGGTPPFSFDWSNDGAEAPDDDPKDLSGLPAGSYTATVTDALDCTAVLITAITAPDALSISGDVGHVSTLGGNDGFVDISVAGGTSPFTFDWSNDGEDTPDDDSEDLSDLEAGTYEVTVTDLNGCTAMASFLVNGPQVFDLALRKTLASGQSPTVQPGESVTFTLTVYNQGQLAATNILVIDYLPTGMTFSAQQNSGWLNFGSGPSLFIGTLAPGATFTKNLKLTVNGNVADGTLLYNYAEISAADDALPGTSGPPVDVDSSPNAYLLDDPGGEPGSLADDVITGDGTGFPGSNDPLTDEDDHDGAAIEVSIPSLSLGNFVFFDYENDGIFNNNDGGVVEVEVELYEAGPDHAQGTFDDEFIALQLTTVDGFYLFSGLSEGFYYVMLNGNGLPYNHLSSTGDGIYDMDGAGSFEPATGTNDNVDDVDDGTQFGLVILSKVIELSFDDEPDGNVNTTVDFGLYEPQMLPTLSLGNLVFFDYDNDGIFNNNDGGIENVEVQLHDAGPDQLKGTNDDIFLASQFTNSFGEYLFTGLAEGFYFINLDGSSIPNNYGSSTGDGVYDLDGAGSFEPATGVNDDVDGTDDGTQIGSMTMSEVIELSLNNEPDGNENYSVDFGFFQIQDLPTLSLGNLVFFDYDNDGVFNNNDEGIEDVEVELYDAGSDHALGTADDQLFDNQFTNGFGQYLFTGLSEGFYYIKLNGIGIPPNHVSSTGDGPYDADGTGGFEPATGTDDDVDHTDDGTQMGSMFISEVIELTIGDEPDGEVNTTVDFGLYEPQDLPASLGNFVWYDNNHNGQQDSGEPGVPDAIVNLFDAGLDGVKGGGDDVLFDSQSTLGDGVYFFPSVPAGNYYAALDLTSLPANYHLVPQNQGDDLTDSDADADGTTAVLTLALGEVNVTVDFGIEPELGSLGSFVWYDYSGDGAQSTGEPGVPGIAVLLFDTGMDGVKGNDDNQIATDITDSNGEYGFTNLEPGTYFVVFDLTDLPAGFHPVTADAGSDDLADSDANPMGVTGIYDIEAGEDENGVDLGIYSTDFDLALTKSLSPGQSTLVDIGDEISYTIQVTNQGDNPAYDVRVVDHIPAGLRFSSNNVGWNLLDPQTAEINFAGPILPSQTVSIEILLTVQYGAAGSVLDNMAEVTDAHDFSGNPASDVDSTPDNSVTSEDDTDEVEIELVPHDPTGWVYCDKTGLIITGGTISVTGPNGIPNDQVFIVHDGLAGYYEFYTNGTPGLYTIVYTHPSGYPLSTDCPAQAGPFDPTGLPDPVVFGVDTLDAEYLADNTCANNPYYLSFEIESGDPNIHLNNLPIGCSFIGAGVFEDTNLNDLADAGDTPLAGETVSLYDCADLITPIAQVISDSNGHYGFDGLVPGDYVVGYANAANTRFVSTGNINQSGFSDCITLGWGQCDTTQTISLYACPTVNAGPDIDHCSSSSSSQLDANLSYGTGSFTWTPPAGLSDAGIENPLASPSAMTTYVVSFNDGFGCVATDTITVTVGTSTPYLTNMPFDDLTVQCAPLPSQTPTFADSCDATLAIMADTTILPLACGYIREITWVATNDEGNTASFIQTLTVEDTQVPTLTANHLFFGAIVQGDTLFADCSMIPALDSIGFASFDNCSVPTVVFTENVISGDCPTDGFYEFRHCGWTSTDACGNVDSLFFNVVIYDNSSPVLSPAPANVLANCTSIPPPATLTATDNCDATLTVLVDDVETVDVNGCVSQITRTWTVEDDCGNLAVATQIITVFDNTRPMFVGVPANVTLNCSATIPTPPTVTATDGCDSDVPVGFNQSTTGNPATGCYSITRTWSVSDDCGNTATATQIITITDSAPPVLSGVPANTSLPCTSVIPPAANVTASDVCDSNVPVTLTVTFNGDTTSGCFDMIRTWSATDDCGNAVSASQTITVFDDADPSFSGVPADLTLSCGTPVPAAPNVTAIDDCGVVDNVTYFQSTSGNPLQGCYTITRTWSASDNCGNSAMAVQHITVEDNTPPTLSAQPADLVLTCITSVPAAPTITATDNCDSNVPVVFFETSIGNPAGCNYELQRIWAATDDCGNSVIWTQTISVNDTVAPVLIGTIPANTTINCNSPLPALPMITATDNCDTNVPVTMTPTYFGDPASGCYVLTRTWTATDDCGNSVSGSQDITVRDTEAPNFVGLPVSGTVSCDNIPGANVTATDNCDASATVTFADHIQSSALGCVTQVVRTWTATDDCGNVRIASRTFNLSNTDPPTITIVAPGMTGIQDGDILLVECDNLVGLSAASATASADCCGAAAITFHEYVSPQNCPGTGFMAVMTCGWIASDCCGNTDSLFFTVYVFDNTPPEFIGVPDSLVLPLGSVLPAPPIVYAHDNCDNTVPVSYNSTTTGPASNQLTTRTWTATDDCGNIATAVQTILISDDDVAPLIANVPPDLTIEGPISGLPDGSGVSATDNLDTDVQLTFVSTTSGNGCCYTVTNTWTATDDFGNTSVATQHIYVKDTQAPVIIGAVADFTGSCSIGQVPMPQLSATDNCTANLTASFHADTTQVACGVQVVRTWIFADECGNSSIAMQTIVLEDMEAPVFNDAPALSFFASQNASANGGPSLAIGDEIGVNETWSIGNKAMPSLAGLATDNCTSLDNIVFRLSDIASANSGCEQTWTLAFEVRDACGNVAATPLTVTATFVDDMAPAFVGVPHNLTVGCGNIPAPTSMTASDAGGGTVTIGFEETQGTGCPYSIQRRWTATDACGNSTVVEQIITVMDNVVPVIANVPASALATCSNIPTIPANVTATDNCSGSVPVVFSETVNGGECSYTIVRTWTATDNCGNSAVKQQYIWVGDQTPPIIATNLPAELTVSCENGLPQAPLLAVSDNCDAAPTVDLVETVLPGNNCSYSVRRTWTVLDKCGNSTIAEQTIHVVDDVLPVLANIPANATVNCGAVPAASSVSATDNCDADVEVIFNEVNVPGCPAKIIRTWVAKDDCGNEAEASQILTVVDNLPPLLAAAPASLNVQCGGEVPVAATLTATDHCGAATVAMQEVTTSVGCDRHIVRTWTATDACGNSASVIQTIEVSDTEVPVFVQVPTDLQLACGEDLPVAPNLPVVDNCDDNLTVDFVETRTVTPCGEDIERTWTVTDDCGNASMVTQSIVYTDALAPTVTEPADLTVDCNGLPPAVAPAFADDCDDDLHIQFTEIATQVECGHNVLRTWTATDNCGNSKTVDQIIHVLDLSAPTLAFANPMLTGLADGDTLTLGCDDALIFAQSDLLATDACSTVEVQLDLVDFANGNCATDGYLVAAKFNWVATDACGNSSTLTLNVKMVDSEPPVFAPTNDVVVNCGEAAPGFVMPEVVGDCSDVAVSFTSQTVSTAYGQDIIGTWTAVDDCGNVATTSQTMQVYSVGAAQLLGVPADVMINLVNGGSVPAAAAVTAIDNCSGDALALDFTENTQHTDNCHWVIERTWSAVGLNGITVSETQTITVNDQVHFTASTTADSCNQSNGQVVLSPASLAFVWNDGTTGATRSDLTAGAYTVTATNANGCTTEATVVVQAACSCDAAIIHSINKNIPACGENKGKVVIKLEQDEANYTYAWQPNLGNPNSVGNARNQLPAGHYEVSITYASFVNCVTTLEVELEDDCPDCGPIFGQTEESITGPPGPTDVCLPVPYGLTADYEIEVDGQPFAGVVAPCDPHPVKAYSYASVAIGGTYSVQWQHDGTSFYTLVNNMGELAAAMNAVDPLGHWFNDAVAKELVSINTGGDYGQLSVRQNSTSTVFNLTATATTSDVGTLLTLPAGHHVVSYTNLTNGCEGEMTVNMDGGSGAVSSIQGGTPTHTGISNSEPDAPGIEVYSVFSPNGDGINDYLRIKGLEGFPNHELRVFNVLGQLVFRTGHYDSNWGGSWGQNNLSSGTYFYLLEDGKGKRYSGHIQIVR